MSVLALALGILGTIFAIIPNMYWLGVVLSVVALVLAIRARKTAKKAEQPTGTATAAAVLGIAGSTLSIVMWISCGMAVNKIERDLDKTARGRSDSKLNDDFNKVFQQTLEESQKPKPEPPHK